MIPMMMIYILFAFSLIISSSHSQLNSSSCGISVYWLPVRGEGSLRDACATGNYKYVNVGFVNSFGYGDRDGDAEGSDEPPTPVLGMGNYCDPYAKDTEEDTCRGLSSEIQFCQDRGIQVLLSIGGPSGSYSLKYEVDVPILDDYLWNSFLGGTNSTFSRPLGDISLDGIDFDIENPLYDVGYWEDLARALSAHSTPQRKVYLSAAVQCDYPDSRMDLAINTGLFDYVWARFYGNSVCDYRSQDASGIVDAWNVWSSSLPANSKLFLGLPASPGNDDTVDDPYIPPDELINNILPAIKSSSNYGGVMLWERYADVRQGYSSSINATVCG